MSNDLNNEDFLNDEIDNQEEKDEILNSVKLSDDENDLKPINKKNKRKKNKVDNVDIEAMSDKEILEISDDEINELYREFSDFVEIKADMKQDSGIKGYVPTGIQLLDSVLGGGFAQGAMNITVGLPGCGKTMLNIQTMGNAQIYFDHKTFCFCLDSEHSTTTRRLSNLGVRYPKIRPYSQELTVEKFFKFIETTCIYKEDKNVINIPSIILFDSIANTLTQKEMEAVDPKDVVGFRSRVYSLLLPKYAAKCSKYNITILAINQLRDNITMGMFPKQGDLKFLSNDFNMPGGKAWKYNACHLLEMKQRSLSKNDIERYGNDFMVEVIAVKNKLFRPKIPVKIIGDFTRGFSNFWTNFVFLVDNNMINTGSWNTLKTYPTKKFRTKELLTLYRSDKDFKQAFDEAVLNTLNEQIIKPNTITDDELYEINNDDNHDLEDDNHDLEMETE